jgi:hypothetical protein
MQRLAMECSHCGTEEGSGIKEPESQSTLCDLQQLLNPLRANFSHL